MDQSIKTNVAPDDSMWRRLRHTPLRDALRLRLTGRLDVRRTVATSGVPMHLQALTLEVVRRTRLWRLEKIAVARELIAHFQDGLASGATLEQMAGSFGEPRTVALLIRKAKKRQRPLWWRTMRRAMQGGALLLLVLLAVYTVLAIRFFTGRPGPVHDYLPQINAAALAAAPGETAWPVYRDAMLAMPKLHGEPAIVLWAQPLGDSDGPKVEQFLLAQQSQLERIREAAQRPVLGFVVGHAQGRENSGLICLLLPHLGELRQIAMILALDAHSAVAAGDANRTMDDLLAIMGLARQCRQPPTIISALVSIAILEVMYDTAGQLLAVQPALFSDDQLQELAHRLAGLSDAEIRVDLSTERQSFIDIVQRVYSDDGQGDGHLTREGLRHLTDFVTWPEGLDLDLSWRAQDVLGPTLLAIVADRRDMLSMHGRLMDDLEAASHQPLWQQHVEAIDAQVEQLNSNLMTRMRYFPITLVMPALSRAIQAGERAMTGRDALQVAIALELFRRRHGDWPAALQELTPALLPAIPIDRFDGAPMRYALREGRPVLYSIGTNHVDDGGTLAMALGDAERNLDGVCRWRSPEQAAWLRSHPGRDSSYVEGDWILWPPVSRQ